MKVIITHIWPRLILTLCCLYICLSIVNGQQLIKTRSGQKIVYTNDGKWALATQYITEDSTGLMRTDMDPKVVPIKKKYAISQNHKKGIGFLLSNAQSKEADAAVLADISYRQLKVSENAYNQIKKDSIVDSLMIAKIKSSITLNKSQLNLSREQEIIMADMISKIVELEDMPEVRRNRSMKKVADELNVDISPYIQIIDRKEDDNKNKVVIDKSKIDYKLEFDCKRDSSYVIGKSSQYFNWFEYSPIKMKRYLKTRDLMHTSCAVAREGDQTLLRVKFIISSKDATKTYGSISRGNFLKVTFTTGKTVHCYAFREAVYKLEEYTGNAVFEAQFVIKRDDVSLFANNPIDIVGIMWSSGFEAYPIYEVDSVMNAFDCFNSLEN
jgi:hypothetical protein